MSEQRVTVAQLCAAMKQRAARPARTHPIRVLVGEDDLVLPTFDGRDEAQRELNARLDADHTNVERLRLVELWSGLEIKSLWPAAPAAERARKLRTRLGSVNQNPDDEQLLELVREKFLRGRVIRNGAERRLVELWWMTADDPEAPVGVLVESERGYSSLALAENVIRPPVDVVYAKLAGLLDEWVRGDGWSADDVRVIDSHGVQGQTFDVLLAKFGLAVATELGALVLHRPRTDGDA